MLKCLEGYNGTIFAYGQTGSGKTYTMSGGETWEKRGLVPRALGLLFREIKQRELRGEEPKFSLFVQHFQIYNEQGYDLLEPSHARIPFEKWSKISLLQDRMHNLRFKGLSVHECTSEKAGIDLLLMGNYVRRVASTPMNLASSRSHSIFTVLIEARDPETNSARLSKLHLVDLAGSERTSKTDPDAATKNEARYINKSLSYLEQVIRALGEPKSRRSHVPFRNSMLTQVLKDSLGGNCRTALIATLGLDRFHAEESLSTLRFA